MWIKDLSWVQEVPNDRYSAYFSLCNKKLNLSNMERRAITSHQGNNGHKGKEGSAFQSSKLIFPSQHVANPNTSIVPESGGTQDNHIPLTSPAVVSDTPHSPVIFPSSGIKKYLLKEDISKSKILWCLQATATHRSLKSAEKDAKLFSQMFEDSEIAKGIR
ncbi:hypothetical protein AVEN_49359-1 [Araneus ventricosus]|uniref:Uncharacterized protein n=1 Tax=Araneus ventricosus TaxID=182803 RepID=A0A4Y2LT54_ARAVE|nr:hypothetical protein AVEN_49359-1 [Araneus ventricosus]